MERGKIYSLGVIVIFITFVIFWRYKRNSDNTEIKEHARCTTATITSFDPGGHGGSTFGYEYTIDGKTLNGNESIGNINEKDAENFVKKTFPLIYSSKNSKYKNLLITPDDFQRFDIPFPDSLTWVKKYSD